GKEEVEINDVVSEEFVDLLHVIYPGKIMISDNTVLHILALADRFCMEKVFMLAETHMMLSKKFTLVEKLKVADQYRLEKLRDHCLQIYWDKVHLSNLKVTPEYADFSADMKAVIDQWIS
ncbi:hypothetical protein PMAYCL1PPCAC_08345, partial [Pristionchus mayeri]